MTCWVAPVGAQLQFLVNWLEPILSRPGLTPVPVDELCIELGEADEHEGEERAAVPLVIEQDMQVVEHVLVQEVGFVEEKDRVDAVASEILDVA